MSSPLTLPPVAGQPPSLLAVIAAPAPADAPVVTLAGSPQALAALAALADLSSFTGTIAAGESPGSLALVTSFGTFALDNAPILSIGAQLTLQTIANTPASVAVLTIDAVPTTGAAATASGTTLLPQTGPGETPSSIVALGTQVTATVISAVASAAANEVAVSLSAPPDPATAPQPRADSATVAEQIVPVLPSSSSDPTQDGAASPRPEMGASAGMAGADSPRGLDRADGSGPLPSTAAALLDKAISSPLTELRPILAGPAETATAPAGPETGAQASRNIAAGTSPSDEAPAASQPPPGTRALPVGASLALRILTFQTAATASVASENPLPVASQPALPTPNFEGAGLLGVVRTGGSAGAIVETAIGPLRLSPVPALSPGTQIALRLVPGEPATAALTVVSENQPYFDASAGTLLEELPMSAPDRPSQPHEMPTSPASSAAAPGLVAPSPRPRRSIPGEAFITRIFIAPTTDSAAAAPRAIIGTILSDAAAPTAASLVETPLGVLAVTPRLALPPGTLLLLAAQDALQPPDALLASRTTSFERGWPALQATIATLSHTAPTLATHLLADLSAHDGETLAVSLLFLVATLRSGGAASWPGEAVERALALAGRDDLKQRLSEDVGELRRIAADPATSHWQVLMLPVHDGTALRPVRLYLARRDKRAGKERRGEDNSRFVLEFELSRIGALQLDGFIRRRRFDLALRSRAPLPAALRADVARIFHDRIAAAGLTGEIDFCTVARFEIAPLDALHRHVGLAV